MKKLTFTPDHYLAASQERLQESFELLALGHYVGAIYLSGVAVECMLRAYRMRDNPAFDARHDLKQLQRDSGVIAFIRPGEQERFGAEVKMVWRLWKNNLRYAESSRLASFYGDNHEFRKYQKDERLRQVATSIFGSTTFIVKRGLQRWTSKKK